jgi:hypothetical protein
VSETFLILRRMNGGIIINIHTRRSSCKIPVVLVRFQSNFNFLDRLSENNQIKKLINIGPVGVELFHADGHSEGQT